jgi:hypothetical protein
MTATFDIKMRITARDPGRSMEFTAVGRSVRGAAGNVRATHVVRLEDGDQGSTRVLLEGDLALGGMLGSVGQKVVAKQAGMVTQSFAEALQQQLAGGAPGAPASATRIPEPGPVAIAEPSTADERSGPPGVSPPGPSGSRNVLALAIAGGIALAGLLVIVRRLTSRPR